MFFFCFFFCELSKQTNKQYETNEKIAQQMNERTKKDNLIILEITVAFYFYLCFDRMFAVAMSVCESRARII